jgi:hypothetical protein
MPVNTLPGVGIRFSRHSPNWRVVKKFHLPKEENNWPIARLASGLAFLLANPEFYSHLASWRVVIRTPDFSLTYLSRTVRM